MDRASHNMSQIGHLHETVAHTSWWIARFKKHGFVPQSGNYKIAVPGSVCCAFVLEANQSDAL